MTAIDTDNIRARVDEFIRTDEILAMCDELDRLRTQVATVEALYAEARVRAVETEAAAVAGIRAEAAAVRELEGRLAAIEALCGGRSDFERIPVHEIRAAARGEGA